MCNVLEALLEESRYILIEHAGWSEPNKLGESTDEGQCQDCWSTNIGAILEDI